MRKLQVTGGVYEDAEVYGNVRKRLAQIEKYVYICACLM